MICYSQCPPSPSEKMGNGGFGCHPRMICDEGGCHNVTICDESSGFGFGRRQGKCSFIKDMIDIFALIGLAYISVGVICFVQKKL